MTRRAILMLAIAALAPCGEVLTAPAQGTVVASVGVTVRDLDEAVLFYTEALSFELLDVTEESGDSVERLSGVFAARRRTARLRLGEEILELTDYLAPEGKPLPVDSRSNDRWFQHVAIVVSDMDAAYARLRERGVRHVSPGPQTLPSWNPNAGGIEAFYFSDPDGHVLELIEFPADKGDPKWRRPTDALFLGIDHTAIVVADTGRSLAFYCDALGLHVAGRSENYGVEQERLNSVFGARLRITTLRGASGPGVELLEYIAPGPGREYPPDAAANDLLHWNVFFTTADGLAADRLRAAHGRWISPGFVKTEDGALAGHVRDPDGHAVVVAERAAP